VGQFASGHLVADEFRVEQLAFVVHLNNSEENIPAFEFADAHGFVLVVGWRSKLRVFKSQFRMTFQNWLERHHQFPKK
jgi:hypothetical protein